MFALVTESATVVAQSQDLIINEGFEDGADGWTLGGTPYPAEIPCVQTWAKSGKCYLILGNVDSNTDHAYQTVSIPADATSITLKFSRRITTAEPSTAANYKDAVTISLFDEHGNLYELANYGNQDANTSYKTRMVDIDTDLAGQEVRLWFFAKTDGVNPTTFRIDDVSFIVTEPTCTFSISPTDVSISASGGSGTVSVSAGNACEWAASASDSWIPLSGNSSGTGNGSFNFSVNANNGSNSRTGNITVADQSVTISQAGSCTYAVSGTGASPDAEGGSGTVSVSAGSACAWSASTSDSWLSLSGTTSGTGNGSFNFGVSTNNGSNSRTGRISVAGQSFTVTQAPRCSFSLSSPTTNISSNGGALSFFVSTGSLCTWSATTADQWITINTGASVTGSGDLNYLVTPNSTAQTRTGKIVVAGITHNVVQAGITQTETIRLRAPWNKAGDTDPTVAVTQHWVPQTYDQHTDLLGPGTGPGPEYAVDLRFATPQGFGTQCGNGASNCYSEALSRNQPIRAAHDGVAFKVDYTLTCSQYCSSPNKPCIDFVIRSHDRSFSTSYVHLQIDATLSAIIDRDGSVTVTAGQVIGVCSDLGCAAGPHLHLMVYRGEGLTLDDLVDLSDENAVLMDGEAIFAGTVATRQGPLHIGTIYTYPAMPRQPIDGGGGGGVPLDSDEDGIEDDVDSCPGTPPPLVVDTFGCVVVDPNTVSCQSSADCDNGVYCDGFELCVDEICQSTGSLCPVGWVCDEFNDQCTCASYCDDHNPCTTDVLEACSCRFLTIPGCCQSDFECDDSLFCNGAERCAKNQCEPGSPPCLNDQVCSEGGGCANTIQGNCQFDFDCDDGRFCNGAERCTHNRCESGAPPCRGGQVCIENGNDCSTVTQRECQFDSDCDDERFCNGREECQGDRCVTGSEPCTFFEQCDEIESRCIGVRGPVCGLGSEFALGLIGVITIGFRLVQSRTRRLRPNQ